MKRRRNSKTYWFAGLVTALGALQGLVPELRTVVPADAHAHQEPRIGVSRKRRKTRCADG